LTKISPFPKCCILPALFLFPFSLLLAQPSSEKTSTPFLALEFSAQVGEIPKPSPYFPNIGPCEFNQLNFIVPYKPGQNWHIPYNSPDIGCAIVFGYLGNKAVLGNQVALLPNIAFETNKQARWGLQTKIGMGLSYFNNPYNIVSNPENSLIGSRITNITCLGFSYRYSPTEKLNLYAGLSIYHFSNGHYTLPNIGIDASTFSLGIKQYLKEKPNYKKATKAQSENTLDKSDTASEKYDNKIHFNLFAGIGRHQFGTASSSDGPRYSVYQLSLFLSKRYGRIHNWQAGLTLTYYADYYDFIINQETFSSNQHLQASTIRPFIGHQFIMNHMGLLTQLGVNVYSPFDAKVNIYGNEGLASALGPYLTIKLGIEYYLNSPLYSNKNKLLIGAYLETRPTGADFPELGLACSF